MGDDEPVRVCLDIQAGVAQRAGVGRYTKSLVEHLAPLAGPDELRLFHFNFRRRSDAFPAPGATWRTVRWCPGRFAQQAWKRFQWPPFDWFSGPADVFHFPNFIIPPLHRGKAVVTIHDLAFLQFPETTEDRNRAFLEARIADTAARADAIIAVSECIAREIRTTLGVPQSRVAAIHSGLFLPVGAPSATDVQETKSALGLDRPYLLTVGTLEPRKNIPFLVEVFEHVKGFDGELVIAGRLGWKVEPILERIRASPAAARIRHLPDVDDRNLRGLYAGAELFVFPSLYEGFGFTPLEAMACGAPVLSSTGGSLPEVLGDAAELAEGFQADAWAYRIAALLNHAERRQILRDRGFRQATRYSWAEAARRTWEVYRSV